MYLLFRALDLNKHFCKPPFAVRLPVEDLCGVAQGTTSCPIWEIRRGVLSIHCRNVIYELLKCEINNSPGLVVKHALMPIIFE